MKCKHWLESPPELTLGRGEIHVWLLDLSRTVWDAAPYLSPAELERAAAYRFDRDRARYRSCRGSLRALLGKYLDVVPSSIEISVTSTGKPFLSGDHAGVLHFNLSHSGDHVLIAFSEEEIGVDIECRDPKFIESGTLALCLSPDERAVFECLGRAAGTEFFFNTWTAKEAYLKLVGDGLAIEPSKIRLSAEGGKPFSRCIHGRDVYFTGPPNIDGCSAAVATFSQPSSISFYTFLRS